jgi:hypothetical protein
VHRRAALAVVVALLAAVSVLSQGSVAQGSVAQGSVAQGSVAQGSVAQGSVAQGSVALGAAPNAPDPPPVTTGPPQIGDNEFLPEDADLTECVGLLQRPGCGSEERGGWRQLVVFALLIGGLAVVFGRVGWSMRSRASRTSPNRTDETGATSR